ncbi:MAG: competence protein ComFB [Candidatus Frackibacter sp. T328-2]|nr:MAG: competence protein ComFB [Candidatus Frackibacter sp. T328-2]
MVSGNLLEDQVSEEVIKYLEEKDDLCTCQQCQDDITALALSNLRPRYAGSEEGKVVISSVDLPSEQTKLDILRAIVNATKKVSKRPHHDR